MKNESYHDNNIMLIMCLVGETAAYALALLFRYVILNRFYWNPTREYDFYKMFYAIVILFYWVLFIYRKKKRVPVWKQEFWDKVLEVFKQHLLLLIGLTLFLYFINWSSRVSRTVMGLMIVFGMFFDLLIRWRYGKRVSDKWKKKQRISSVLLVAEPEEAQRLKWSIEHYGYRNEWKDIYVQCKVQEVLTAEDFRKDRSQLLRRRQETDMIYISTAGGKALGEDAGALLEQYGIPYCFEAEAGGQVKGTDMVVRSGGNPVVFRSVMSMRSPVLGVDYTTANITEVAEYLIGHVKELSGKYICFSNVHTTVMAADDPGYKEILNHSAMTFPDGAPVAKCIREAGYAEAERVAGPDLMAELFRQSMGSGRKHYFYGSTEKTIQKLRENLEKNYPWMEIVGMVSPPFRELTEEEDAEVVAKINESGADFIWIGLGAPKQEKWMRTHAGKLRGVMLGVGAGFDFHAGTIRRAPVLIQKLGLEWLYRLVQNPGRLFKRYFITNTKFLWYTKVKR